MMIKIATWQAARYALVFIKQLHLNPSPLQGTLITLTIISILSLTEPRHLREGANLPSELPLRDG